MPALIQANQALWDGPARRMLLFKWALCAALLCAVLFSPKLWMTDRGFPTIPLVEGLPDLPQVACLVLSSLLVLSILAVAILPRPRLAIYAAVALMTLFILFDIARLQPCIYQYTLMLLGLCLMPWDDPESRRSRAAWAVCAVPIVAVYFWSGLQKANMTFATEIFPWLIRPVVGDRLAEHLTPLWFFAPIIESSIGILLLLPRTRRYGLAAAVAMHGFLLLALGPLGLNYNSIVWPWNVWILTMAFVLFSRNREPVLSLAWSAPIGKGIVLLIGIVPALNFADRWDGFLSASYYSGRLRDGWLYFTAEGFRRLPAAYSEGNKDLVQETPNRYRLDITQWAITKLNVPPYAEPRIYQQIARKLEQAGVPPKDMVLYVRDRKSPSDGSRTYTVMPIH